MPPLTGLGFLDRILQRFRTYGAEMKRAKNFLLIIVAPGNPANTRGKGLRAARALPYYIGVRFGRSLESTEHRASD